MNFRLVYEGPLKATSRSDSRAEHKHQIRQKLHPQLKQLWAEHPPLSKNRLGDMDATLGAEFHLCGRSFVPMVFKRLQLVCHLDILFLRREPPGGVIRSGGDLDNRLKTLFDALRIPDNCSGIGEPSDDERLYFYCLLEDDKQITGFSVITDRLWVPLKEEQAQNDVSLVIRVSVKSAEAHIAAPGFPLA